MKSKRLSILSIVLMIPFLCMLSSCKKKVAGCTDESATNFLFEANEDDGSCLYSAEISFWYDNATRDSLLANGHQSLAAFLDPDNSIVIYPDFTLWSAEPDCANNTARLTANLGYEKTKVVPFKVALDDMNNVVWQGSMELTNGGCALYQIIW